MIRILKYGQVARNEIFARVAPEVDVEAVVSQIIADVRENRDAAVFEYCRKFDRVTLTSLEVTREAQGELPVGAALLRVTAAGETLVEIRVAWQEGN